LRVERSDKPRRLLTFAIGALLIAAATWGGIAWLGSEMSSAHSGLGGKLGAPGAMAPAGAPGR